MKKSLVINDPPSCDFIRRNIKMEEKAIEEYMAEWARTDSLALKAAFENLGIAEMHHLQMLEEIGRSIGCNIEKS